MYYQTDTKPKAMKTTLEAAINKAARIIAPYKTIEKKEIVLAALVSLFSDLGFDVTQSLVLSVKAYRVDVHESVNA